MRGQRKEVMDTIGFVPHKTEGDLVVGQVYWVDIGVCEMALELRNIYKNGKVRLTWRDKYGNLMYEMRCPSGHVFGKTETAQGVYRAYT